MLPFRHIPRIVLIHLVKNAVFWINAVPTNDGITRQYSPRYIMTGQQLLASKHAVLPFGSYVQTHEQHTNDMNERTLSCICLGPTGNVQGGHWFMSLASGDKLIRYRWTELPMPSESIDRVNAIACRQQMPSNITYANREGVEIMNTVDSYPDDASANSQSDSDDDDYSQTSSSDDDSISIDSIDDNASSVHTNTPAEHTAAADPHQLILADPLVIDNNPGVGNLQNQGVENPGVGDDDFDDNVNEDEEEDDFDDNVNEDKDKDADANGNPTESELFRLAEDQGRAQAMQPHPMRPRRSNYDNHSSYVTAQMSAKKGLQVFGNDGASALMKELHQIVTMKVMSGCNAHELSKEQKQRALQYLMFLKEKRCGRIKGRGCADGRKQRLWKTKEETTSPTVCIEALYISCMIDAMENRDIATLDIPGAFMQASIDEEVHVKFDKELVDLLCQVDPSLKKYVTIEGSRRVLYTKLNKALYGTVQASRLFWEKLSSFLVNQHGFEQNPYDFCVVNKMINGKQFTIIWYVDDLKFSHVDSSVVTKMIEAVKSEFGKEYEVTVHRGKVHDYLGMQLDFSNKGKVVMTMRDYIDELIKEVPEDLLSGKASTPASNFLFNVNPKCSKLGNETSVMYHHLTAKLLYLSKRVRPDILTAVSFLCTRVQEPDQDDWKKLGRCLKYLSNTADLKYTLAVDDSWTIRWWVDASYGVHPDMKSHTGATMSMGQGCVYSMSRKQKLNTRSSTEAELVGANDAMSMILWIRRFVEAQGYMVNENTLYQDNQSAMLLEKNGKMSSSKRTRHLEIRFFFITDNVAKKNLRIEHCPTDDMVGDFYTKPLQGSKFVKHRNRILGISFYNGDDMNPPVCKECVEDSGPAVHYDDDKAVRTTPWIEVVSKKNRRPDAFRSEYIRSGTLMDKQK